MNYDKVYREWRSWPRSEVSLTAINESAETVSFYREKNSHRGIGRFTCIKNLSAKQVNQDFLNEICLLGKLECLEIEVITAEDLSPLTQLGKLKLLKLDSVRNAKDFQSLIAIASLRKLFIENAKHLDNIDFLGDAHNLIALGIEGGMYKKQKVASLQPLSGLKSLEALFMSSVQLGDKNLDYLSTIPNLKYLGSARFAPRSSFTSLRQLMPGLICNWCDAYEV